MPELSGPDDTRYFEDEEDESKKMVPSNVKKSKDYAGNALPFIGYTYLQHSKPEVTLQRGPLQKSQAAQGNASDPADKIKIMQLEEEVKKLKGGPPLAQLEATPKKAAEDDASAITIKKLKNEIAGLKEEIADSLALKQNAESNSEKVEKEKSSLEAEIKKLNLDREHNAHEREGIEEKMAQLKQSLDKEMKANNEGQTDAQDLKARLERQVASMKEELDSQKVLMEEYSKKTETAIQQAESSSKEAEENRSEKNQVQQALDEANVSIGKLERKLARESERLDQAEKSLDSASKREAEIKKKLETAEESLATATLNIEESNNTIKKMGREFAKLEQNYAELVASTSEASDSNKNSEENARLESQKAHYESEISAINEDLEKERGLNKDLKAKMFSLNSTVEEIKSSLELAKDRVDVLTKDADHHLSDISRLESELKDAREKGSAMDEKIAMLVKEKIDLEKDSLNLMEKSSKDTNISADYKKRIKELEQLLDDESKLKLHAESSLRNIDAEKQELQGEVTRLQSRISAMKESEGTNLQDKHSMDERLKTLELNEESMKSEIKAATDQISKLKAEEDVLKKSLQSESNKSRTAVNNLRNAEALVAELSSQVDTLTLRILDDDIIITKKADRIHELEDLVANPGSRSSKRASSIHSMDNNSFESTNSSTKRVTSLGNLLSKEDTKKGRSGGILGMKLKMGRHGDRNGGEKAGLRDRYSENEYDDSRSGMSETGTVTSLSTNQYDNSRNRKPSTISNVSSSRQPEIGITSVVLIPF